MQHVSHCVTFYTISSPVHLRSKLTTASRGGSFLFLLGREVQPTNHGTKPAAVRLRSTVDSSDYIPRPRSVFLVII